MKLISIDDGFRRTKAIIANPDAPAEGFRTQVQFSSAAPGLVLGSTGAVGVDGLSGAYSTEGRDFTVDPHIDGDDTRFDGYALSDLNRVLVHHAMHSIGLSGQQVTLATGLPLGTYFDPSGRPRTELIGRKKRSLEIAVTAHSGAEPIRVVRQIVCPQGVAAFADWLIDDTMNVREGRTPSDRLAIIDIGGRTTDTAMVVGSGRIDMRQSGTVNIGVGDVLDELRMLLMAEFKVSAIRTSSLEAYLRERKAVVRGKPHDISGHVDQAIGSVFERIAREVQRRLGDAYDVPVYVVGGGAHLMAGALKKIYDHAEIAPEAEFANARGFYKFLAMADEADFRVGETDRIEAVDDRAVEA